jgi:phage terminase large subunit GpA-like protein
MADTISRKALELALLHVGLQAFAPWIRQNPAEFAESLRMPAEHGATIGFSFDFFPPQKEMYEELFNPQNRKIIYKIASRLTKTTTILAAIGYFIIESPRRIGVMWPKIGDGEVWSKKQLVGELIDPNPIFNEVLQDGRGRRMSNNTILNKSFPGGYMSIFGANVPGDLRRFKGNFLYADEIDAIAVSETDEGDQLKQFSVRGSEYPDTIEVLSSYPSLKGASHISDEYDRSDRRVWMNPCLSCGQDWIMHRKHLRYDISEPENAKIECPNCLSLHDDKARYEMSRQGRWVATLPFNGVAGFHCNAMLWPHEMDKKKYPGGFLHMLALEEIAAETADNPERARRVIVNTRDAETYESEVAHKPDHSALFLRREEYDPKIMLPSGVLAIFFFVDLQVDRLELFIDGYGLQNQIWALDYQIIRGTPLAPPDQGAWAELDRILASGKYPHPSGRYLSISGGLIDCGYKPDNVFAFTRTRALKGIFASRGATQLGKPIIQRRYKKEGNPWARVWEIGTHEAKDILYQRLELDNASANGYQHFPKLGQFSEHYFSMLVAEDSIMKRASDGKFYRWFSCDDGVRNEALDGRIGTMAIERIIKPKYAKLAIDLAVNERGGVLPRTEEKANLTASSAVSKPKQRPFVQAGRNFISSWRK